MIGLVAVVVTSGFMTGFFGFEASVVYLLFLAVVQLGKIVDSPSPGRT